MPLGIHLNCYDAMTNYCALGPPHLRASSRAIAQDASLLAGPGLVSSRRDGHESVSRDRSRRDLPDQLQCKLYLA
jgi:hypothetical protein